MLVLSRSYNVENAVESVFQSSFWCRHSELKLSRHTTYSLLYHTMNYLPLPMDPIGLRLEISLRDSASYDEDDFLEYPEHQGWAMRTPEEWLPLFAHPTRDFAAFFERWLLLGPIFTAFNKLPDFKLTDFFIKTDSLKREDESEQVDCFTFTAARLPGLLGQLRSLVLGEAGTESSNDYLKRFALIHTALLEMHNLNGSLSSAVDDTGDSDYMKEYPFPMSLPNMLRKLHLPDPRRVEISIVSEMVIELIFTGLLRISTEKRYNDSQKDGQDAENRDTGPYKNNPDFGASMRAGQLHSGMWRMFREKGWCPADMSRLFARFGPNGLYYIYNLSRPRPRDEHPMIRKREAHISKSRTQSTTQISSDPTHEGSQVERLCSTSGCPHRQLQDTTYTTQHVEGCPGCSNAVADQNELARILEERKLPLIMSIDEDEEASDITLVESDLDEPLAYIALSHVWSDGLGNVQRNAIPLCQLRRLSKMVRNMPGPCQNTVLFWLDTICVPPDSAKQLENAQQIAMGSMRDVYQLATGVLVLDSWLFDSQTDDDDLERVTKILSCAWNSRLWTFQEGALAKRLYFQFKDIIYDLDDGFERLRLRGSFATDRSIVMDAALLPSLDVLYFDLRGFRRQTSWEEKLEVAASALATRTTSVSTDEALCIAVLLDLDVEDIARTSPPLRFQRLWEMLPGCPRQLVFTKKPTLETPGLHWAPRSFLMQPMTINETGGVTFHREGRAEAYKNSLAPRYEDGVLIQASGIRAVVGGGLISAPLERHLCVKLGRQFWYILKRIPEIDTRPEDLVHGCIEIAFIDGDDYRLVTEADQLPRTVFAGIIVRIDRDPEMESDGIIRCTKLFPAIALPTTDMAFLVYLEAMLPELPDELGTGTSVARVDPDTGYLQCVLGRRVDSEQLWCIR